jgi:hypothetical protein
MRLAAPAAFGFVFATLIVAPSPVLSDTKLPPRKIGKGTAHEFQTTISFDTSNDVNFKRFGIIEQALILACNKVHPTDQLYMNEAAIIETNNYPAPTFASNSGDVKDSLHVSQQIEQSNHTKAFDLLGGYVCALCSKDDPVTMFIDVFFDSETSHKQWQDALCSILALYDDFADVDNCRIEVKFDDKIPTNSTTFDSIDPT